MFPANIITKFPVIFQESAGAKHLATYLDNEITTLKGYLTGIMRFMRPDECDQKMVNDLGELVAAGIRSGDTDRVKRQKIQSAIQSHKNRGLWADDVKILIDIITNAQTPGTTYSSELYGNIEELAEWILLGNTVGEIPATRYTATLGANGTDLLLGIDLTAAGTEPEIAGNVYINLHPWIYTAVLTADTITALRDELINNLLPAYMIIYLGYTDAGGAFNLYTNGVI